MINHLLRLIRRSYQLWYCPTCGRRCRTLGRTREYSAPMCGHAYTPFVNYPMALMIDMKARL